MALTSKIFILVLAFFLSVGTLDALAPFRALKPSFPDAVSDLKESVVRALGSQAEGWEMTGFDVKDALVGQSMVYEFHVEIDKRIFPIKLLEDANWSEFVDYPVSKSGMEVGRKDLAEMGSEPESRAFPVLKPFQLAGPLELWIQDGDDMRISLPHDVDAGVLKKVILSDGAVVTVKGARSISLRHPVELPLPLNRSGRKGRMVASGLLSLAEALRDASRSNEKPILSLRIVGPTSITSSSTSSTDKTKLKLKRLAPGLVELSSPVPIFSTVAEDSDTSTLWPLTSFNGSEMSLGGFEELLASVLGEEGTKKGSFRLVKAEASARTYVKLSFKMAKRLLESEADWSAFPDWMTRPEKVSSHFEVLARVEDNGEVIPERIAEFQPIEVQDSILPSVLTGNVTMSTVQIHHPPLSFFTL